MPPETSSSAAVDWEVLRDFLMSDRTPDTCMRPAEVDGYLTGIAVSPDMIPPSDWLPVIWGGGEPEFKSIEETSRVLSLVLRHHSNIRLMLDRTPEAYQPVLLDSSTGRIIAEDWARGFFAAVIDIDQFWRRRQRGAVPPTRQTVSGSTAKVGRNDPCPCGSGKKYKRCCGT